VFARHRHEYLVAHALLRTALSRYAPVAPSAWTFTRGPSGKPETGAAHRDTAALLQTCRTRRA